MKYRTARMTSLVLAFGIFFSFSCSSLKKTESANQTKTDTKSLQNEIREVNRKISEDPENAGLQSEKAGLLYSYSQTIPDPAIRNLVYVNMRDIADNFISRSENIPKPVNDVLLKAWRTEQRSGIKLLQENPSGRSGIEATAIISHFENAVTIIPDSLKTYSLLATTHYQHGNLNKAIETLEKADRRNDQANPEIFEKLAYLYLESGDLAEAERRYRFLVENYPENLLYKHGLVNVLILSDKHEETIDYLEELSEEYPTRYSYQESLATELYYLFKNRTDRYLQNGADDSLSASEQEELVNLLNSVHSIFESIQESLPTTEENLFRMAVFYKNASLRLKDISASLSENSFSELQTEFMEYALPLWENLAEQQPDNLGYISNLHQVYVELGMDEDAETIERSYNF